MKLIVGLGNPGFGYRHTRHNAGFMVIDRLAERLGAKVTQRAYRGLVGRGVEGGVPVALLKPMTMMNLSGLSVDQAVEDLSVAPRDVLVVYDEVQLDPGQIRLRPKGSAGGHNGAASIIRELGTQDFPRLRVGVGGADKQGRANYVLKPFGRSEWPAVREALEEAADACLLFVREGIEAAMNRYNG
jgi:PTH1 family peptidyl-tRNA hydrolase